MTPITALGSRYGIQGALGRSVKRAAVGGWWLSGGIAAANCIAAYQPKGAASYAASLVNLANPGVNNMYTIGTAPDWDSVYGWKYLFASKQSLRCNWVISNTLTIIIRFSNYEVVPSDWGVPIIGATESMSARDSVHITPIRHKYIDSRIYIFGQTVIVTTKQTNAVMAVNKNYGYLNGLQDATFTGTGVTYCIGEKVAVGCVIRNNIPLYFTQGNIQAVALYDNNRILTAAEIAAVSTAMAAL